MRLFLQIYGLGLLWGVLGILIPSFGNAGELVVNFGGSFPASKPTGDFVDARNLGDGSIGSRLGVRYWFDSGLSLGRTAYSGVFTLDDFTDDADDTTETLLVISSGYFTVGWVFGDTIRFLLEAGIAEPAAISVRDTLTSDADDLQLVDAYGYGLGVDFGSEGLGLLFEVNYDVMETNDLFGTGQDLQYQGANVGLSVRYAW